MKRIYYILLIAVMAASCKKLIEIPPSPPGQLSTQKVFADSADIMSAVAGLYLNINANTTNLGFASGIITYTTGIGGDEVLNNIASSSYASFTIDALTSDNGSVSTMWTQAYQNIYQMNACLAGIPGCTTINQSLKDQFMGEVKVMRAFYYFNLVNLFGQVPLVTSTDFNVTDTAARVSVDAIYNLIIQDLTDAHNLLKPAYPSAGHARPNLYTASALLAKVYLYRQQWVNAANLAGEVINSNTYALRTGLDSVFYDGSKEAIWQLATIGTTTQVAEGYSFVPPAGLSTPPNFSLNPALLSDFEAGDKRYAAWVRSMTALGNTYSYPYKYKNLLTSNPKEDYMIFRLGETYLIRAEALAEQGKTDSALADLNTIRARAGLGASTAAGQTAILDSIQHERRIEMFCEWGNRWYDMKRWGTINSVMTQVKPAYWQPYAALYPIPIAEIRSNPFLTQNPVYN